jgi:hypothetical protein
MIDATDSSAIGAAPFGRDAVARLRCFGSTLSRRHRVMQDRESGYCPRLKRGFLVDCGLLASREDKGA